MRVALRDLADHLADTTLTLDEEGAPVDPLVIVDLDDVEPDERTIRAVECASPRVLVGVACASPRAGWLPLLRALDLTLVPTDSAADRCLVGAADLVAECDALTGATRANPRAALALTGLLRVTDKLPAAQGLFAESAVYSMLLAGPEFARWRSGQPRRPLPAYDRPPVLIERDEDTLEIRLDCSRRRNAFSRQMRDGLVAAFDLVLADPSIASVRVTGAGPVFCSGGDLDEFGSAADVSLAHIVRLDRSVAMRIGRCRERVSVWLHGAAIGAGIELPSFAGTVTARPDTVIQLPELRMGLVPGAGGTVGITRRIGRWRTAYLALTGSPVDVTTALSWGLVDQVA